MSLHLYRIDCSLPLPCLSHVTAPPARHLWDGPHVAQHSGMLQAARSTGSRGQVKERNADATKNQDLPGAVKELETDLKTNQVNTRT